MKVMYRWDFPEKEIRLQKLQITLRRLKDRHRRAVFDNSIYGNCPDLVDTISNSIRTIENQIIDLEKPE